MSGSRTIRKAIKRNQTLELFSKYFWTKYKLTTVCDLNYFLTSREGLAGTYGWPLIFFRDCVIKIIHIK